MVLIAYERDIPNAPNNPSVDQPDMKANNNAIDDILSVDHYSFNNNSSGWHKYLRLPVTTIPTVIANQAGFYSKTANSTSNLFFTNDATGNEYQLTRAIDASFGIFATNGGANGTGWTFLPGGLLLQWGSISISTGTTVNFPITFSTGVFSVQTTPLVNANDRIFLWVKTVSNSNFTCALRDSGGSGDTFQVMWMAIGK